MADPSAPEKMYLEERLRSFVYLSTTKVPVLFSGLKPTLRERLGLKLHLAAPIVPGPSVDVELPPQSKTLVDMLGAVVSRLDEKGQIRTVDEPGRYFAGGIVS
jgi:hypothetical protein